MSDRKLKAWHAAGLIDEATVARIKAWETEQSSPWGLWALIGLGALTIGLGLISLIAANWEALAGSTRLIIHFIILAGFAAWLGLRDQGDATLSQFADAGLMILVFLGVTFIGHVGQVYQSSAPIWQALALALLIFSPLLILFGRTKLTGLLWLVGLLATVATHMMWYVDSQNHTPVVYLGLMAAVPALATGAAMIAPLYGVGHPGFWRAVEKTGLLVLAWSTTMLTIIGMLGASEGLEEKYSNMAVLVILTLVAAAGVWVLRRDKDGRGVAMVLALCAGVTVLASGMTDYVNIVNAMLVIGLWGGIAWISLGAEWRRLFQTAVGVAAIRLIILSFELGGDLLGSGVGLIITGLITLGIAWMAFRISRTYAPRREGDAA